MKKFQEKIIFENSYHRTLPTKNWLSLKYGKQPH